MKRLAVAVARSLFPRDEENDPAFRAEIERLSVIGLRVIGAICVTAPLFMYVLGTLFLPSLPDHAMVISDLILVGWGLSLIAVSFVPALAPWSRSLGILAGGGVASVQIWSMLASSDFHESVLGVSPEQHFPTTAAIVMFIGIAALPLKPWQALGLGAAIVTGFTGVISSYGARGLSGWAVFPILESVLIVAMCTGLAAVVYSQRSAAFAARQRAERSFEELKRAQSSLLVERNAASQARFAAALSHELNTPLGALSSSVETLWRLVQAPDAFPNGDRRRRAAVEESVRTGRASLERLDGVVERMRHLSNLDRADQRLVDLNELCMETAALLDAELADRRVEFQLASIPSVRCRPQQLGAVLSNLLRNAAAASHRGSPIRVRSRARDGRVVVEVEDQGRGIEPERLVTLFEPEFHVADGRVTTKNWGLFVSRSIVAEHGGTLDLESAPGRGTTARVALPAREPALL